MPIRQRPSCLISKSIFVLTKIEVVLRSESGGFHFGKHGAAELERISKIA